MNKEFIGTEYQMIGDTTHDFGLKVHEQFKLALNLSDSSLSNAILHKRPRPGPSRL